MVAEALTDGTTITLSIAGLTALATFVAGYAALRAKVVELEKRQNAADRTLRSLDRWRNRTIGAAAARREDSDVHRTLTNTRIIDDDPAGDSRGD